MKYMISWFERPQGSPAEYENAQKRKRPKVPNYQPANAGGGIRPRVSPRTRG